MALNRGCAGLSCVRGNALSQLALTAPPKGEPGLSKKQLDQHQECEG